MKPVDMEKTSELNPTIHISAIESPDSAQEMDLQLLRALKDLRDQRQEDQQLIEKLRKVC
jgi:hypothetical protein